MIVEWSSQIGGRQTLTQMVEPIVNRLVAHFLSRILADAHDAVAQRLDGDVPTEPAGIVHRTQLAKISSDMLQNGLVVRSDDNVNHVPGPSERFQALLVLNNAKRIQSVKHTPVNGDQTLRNPATDKTDAGTATTATLRYT